MSKASILQRMLGVAVFAAMFGATGAYAQSTQSSTSNTKDAAGLTKENKAGQMSPTGQNETTSVTPPKGKAAAGASGSSGSSSSSASSDSTASASGKSASGKTLGKNDQNMMRELAYANISEIEAGKLAQTKSQNDQVKQFAQKMIDDHTKAMEELQTLAQAKGVTLPKEPDAKHKAAAKMMSALSSEKFDKQYMAQGGLRDHRNTHKLLSRMQDRATDPDLKALASKTTPVVDQHLKMAQDMAGAKSTGNMSGSSMGPAGTSGTANSGSGSSGTSGSSASGTTKTPSVSTSTADTTSGNSATGGSSAASRAPSTGTGDKSGTATDTGTNTTGTTGSK
jgi:putative membrane protein